MLNSPIDERTGTEMSHLENRVVLITGAGSGFGRLVACKAAARGAKVVGCDIDEATLEETLAMVRDAGGTALGQVADVTVAEELAQVVAAAVAEYGGIDVLLNSAGIMPLAYYADHAEALTAWHRCIDLLDFRVCVCDSLMQRCKHCATA